MDRFVCLQPLTPPSHRLLLTILVVILTFSGCSSSGAHQVSSDAAGAGDPLSNEDATGSSETDEADVLEADLGDTHTDDVAPDIAFDTQSDQTTPDEASPDAPGRRFRTSRMNPTSSPLTPTTYRSKSWNPRRRQPVLRVIEPLPRLKGRTETTPWAAKYGHFIWIFHPTVLRERDRCWWASTAQVAREAATSDAGLWRTSLTPDSSL